MNNRFRSRHVWPSLLTFGMVSASKAQTFIPDCDPKRLRWRKNTIFCQSLIANLAIQEQTNKEVTALALPKMNGTAAATDYFNIPVTLVPGEFFQQPAGSYYRLSSSRNI